MELICGVKNYHWGKKGGNSLVAKFAKANSEIVVNNDTPYAELWMGAHLSGPSLIKDNQTELSQHITQHPKELGCEAVEDFGCQLPFLMKILSVEQPLSIQVHPNKSQAEELFQKFPEIYKDSNHKPEIAVALTECELLCSFRAVNEIRDFLKSVPELTKLINLNKLNKFINPPYESLESIELMKECFQDFIQSEEKVVAAAIEELLARSKTLTTEEKKHFLIPVVEKINLAFPNDIGVLCVYFFNYVTLKPGESVFVSAGEPHAYISGDFMECMSNSDNVVRAALTPKLRDIPTLLKILSYKCCESNVALQQPLFDESEFFCVISSPVKEFAIGKYKVPKNKKCVLSKRKSASILCVLEGKGKMNSLELKFGKVFFIPAEKEFSIESEEDLLMFQAFCNEEKWLNYTRINGKSTT